MSQNAVEKEIAECIELLHSIQKGISNWSLDPAENSMELGKAVKDRESTARRLVELCEQRIGSK